jgi:acid phosphatase type 7
MPTLLALLFCIALPVELHAQQAQSPPDPPRQVATTEPARFDPVGVFLTWQRDPTTTMTIDWHTTADDRRPELQYRQSGETSWQSRAGSSFPFPFSDRTIHRVELTDLEPGTTYDFRFGEDSRSYVFRTMPADAHRPIRFAAGGDVRGDLARMEATHERAAAQDVEFIIWGGDLAYADGREDRVERWHEFFDGYKSRLITAENRVIPAIVAIGNHEVRGGYYHRDDHPLRSDGPPYSEDDDSRVRIAPYFYRLFAFPGQPGYNVLDFGNYMSIISLDTDHTNPVDGAQARWLEQVLADRQQVPHIFPHYHVTAYPSVRHFDGDVQSRIRQHWVPLFEQYNVRTAFENHDHAYKRTYPIRQGSMDPTGVVYLGDGTWGVTPRVVGRDHDEDAWYLASAASSRHFILVTIHGSHQHFLAIDPEGNVIDEYPETPEIHTAGEGELRECEGARNVEDAPVSAGTPR